MLGYAETASQEQAMSLALREMERARREYTKGIDLVVDFRGLEESTLRTNGAALLRRVIGEAAERRGFCNRVFFVDFPDDYRLHCARWRNELPRDFRRKIWCVAAENLAQ